MLHTNFSSCGGSFLHKKEAGSSPLYVVMHLLKWLQVHNGKYGFGEV